MTRGSLRARMPRKPTGNPPGRPKRTDSPSDAQLRVKFTTAERAAIDASCAARGLSMAQAVRLGLAAIGVLPTV